MENEIRNCQNCTKTFTVESDDFSFYEKINVPVPTFCPECRAIRRFGGTNERVLYYRTCDLSGEKILSMYPEDVPFPVYHPKHWYNDGWDAYRYGKEYDFSKPFFQQFLELRNQVPKMATVRQGESVNSEYTHRVNDMKNSYMVFRTTKAEDCFYTYIAKNITDCADCFAVSDCELCYECIDCNRSYRLRFSQESDDCRDSLFLYGCRNCTNCVGCVNLVSKEYCIFNEQYSKEEYEHAVKNLALDTASGIKKMEKTFDEFRKRFPQRAVMSLKSNAVSGNWFVNCQNVKHSYWCSNMKDCKYAYYMFDAQDCMDHFQWGNSAELLYESSNCGINVSRIYFSTQCWMGAHDLTYCDSCPGSSYCFGSIGIKKGEYVILNKQYSKEEYEALVPKIIEHMKAMPYVDQAGVTYRFGEHFPLEHSPFAYNETAAIDFYPITKEEALSKGYRWKDRNKREYVTDIEGESLPESISEVSDDITQKTIGCAEKDSQYSTGAFRVGLDELNFYRKLNLPLPQVCFDIRHRKRLLKRPAPKLGQRTCSKCALSLETVYTESFAPILYCQTCYQEEVFQ